MKQWKKCIVIVGAVLILFLTSTVSSYDNLISTLSLAETETDGTNDVFHRRMADGAWGYVYTAEKDNIDLTEISYDVNEGQLTLTLKVDGVIEDSEMIVYYVYYTSAEATYWMMYLNGTGMMYCDKDYNISAGATVTKTSDDTITGVCSLYGTDSSNVDLYGTAYQYTSVDAQFAEYWVDWNPDDHSTVVVDEEESDATDGNTTDDNGDSGTPGFEVVLFIAAIAVAFVLMRRKK